MPLASVRSFSVSLPSNAKKILQVLTFMEVTQNCEAGNTVHSFTKVTTFNIKAQSLSKLY